MPLLLCPLVQWEDAQMLDPGAAALHWYFD